MEPYRRKLGDKLKKRLKEKRKFIQVLHGARQVGKTTLARQVIDQLKTRSFYATADAPTLKSNLWIQQQWEQARLYCEKEKKDAILVLDEIQKVDHWSEVVKQLWDEDTHNNINLKVLLLGSSPLLIQKGLTESLAGRFEMMHTPHWSFDEMKDGFGFTLDQYIYFGGYPGAAGLIKDTERWKDYILNSLVETSISRDILLTTRVDKPAILRQLFELACLYSGQILSYQKALGQLQDAGNSSTLAHYLRLLAGAGMVSGIFKYSGSKIMTKSSSPKMQVFNTALISCQEKYDFKEARKDLNHWGRLVEASIGAHLLNHTQFSPINLQYWRQGNDEVDFLLEYGDDLIAIEVKSGSHNRKLKGMESFNKKYNPKRSLLIGGDGIPLDEFLNKDILYWF